MSENLLQATQILINSLNFYNNFIYWVAIMVTPMLGKRKQEHGLVKRLVHNYIASIKLRCWKSAWGSSFWISTMQHHHSKVLHMDSTHSNFLTTYFLPRNLHITFLFPCLLIIVWCSLLNQFPWEQRLCQFCSSLSPQYLPAQDWTCSRNSIYSSWINDVTIS